MKMKEQLKREAYLEYMKEKDQVDRVINKMIDEDTQIQNLTRMKQD